MTFEQLKNEWVEFIHKTFPDETASQRFKHLREEVKELGAAMDDPLEYADVLLLLIAIADRKGIDLVSAMAAKININRARKWKRSERGYYKRDK